MKKEKLLLNEEVAIKSIISDYATNIYRIAKVSVYKKGHVQVKDYNLYVDLLNENMSNGYQPYNSPYVNEKVLFEWLAMMCDRYHVNVEDIDLYKDIEIENMEGVLEDETF